MLPPAVVIEDRTVLDDPALSWMAPAPLASLSDQYVTLPVPCVDTTMLAGVGLLTATPWKILPVDFTSKS